MDKDYIAFEEFEKLLINTINTNYINNCNHNYQNNGLLNEDCSYTTINDYIQIYKFNMKMKDKNKIQKLEKEIEDLKIQNNRIMVLCGIVLSVSIIKLFI
jgi:hypothetical protein